MITPTCSQTGAFTPLQIRFKFANSKDGFGEALEKARAEAVKAGCRGVILAIETGGRFWRKFAYLLEERGIPFRLRSQFTLNRMRHRRGLNRRGNDFRDARMGARVLRNGDFTETRLP